MPLNYAEYRRGMLYWRNTVTGEIYTDSEVKDVPTIPREEFLNEFRTLIQKYNVSICVDYNESDVTGQPFNMCVFLGDFEVLKVDNSVIGINDIK